MTSSQAPLFGNPSRYTRYSAAADDDEETALLGGLATTSPTRPFAAVLHPTLYTRTLAFLLALPSFILFLVHGAHFPAQLVFLSFALARQLVVLGSFFGSQLVVIRIEVVHHRLKSVSARAQERWIKRLAALVVDGVILLGLLVSLSVAAANLPPYCGPVRRPVETAGVVFGFLALGLLLLSVPDFGYPGSVSLAIAVEKPEAGLLKIASSVQFGETEELGENGTRDTGKNTETDEEV